jgi:tRNA uridine 5-carboxymethylaminomethyl modification enzyme
MTFPDRDHHPLFLEPEGVDTNEMYLNGFSSSMPIDAQIEALRHIPALRNMKVYRPGYAIEYDYFDPTQLLHTLESKVIKGLFLAGQVNGTTGYEEAAGQGLVAGVNAALRCTSDKEFILHRDEAYIGVLIDDLVTKGVDEPYRMFTSRAEYRILLRQDDADARLTPLSHSIGLASTERLRHWQEKEERINRIEELCRNTTAHISQVNSFLESIGSTPLRMGCKVFDLISRPMVNLKNISTVFPELKAIIDTGDERDDEVCEAAEVKMKYSGYISRERMFADKMHRLENIRIKGHFAYEEIKDLSTEARQKLSRINPDTLAQASRIPGVSPSDINVLLVLMNR